MAASSAPPAPPFECDIIEPDGEVLAAISGELDVATLDDLEHCLRDVISRGKPVFLDLAGADFVDGRGLQAILGAGRALNDMGETLTVATPSRLVQRLLLATPGAPNITVLLVQAGT